MHSPCYSDDCITLATLIGHQIIPVVPATRSIEHPERDFDMHCFNPCCIGLPIKGFQSLDFIARHDKVSILVVLDYPLRDADFIVRVILFFAFQSLLYWITH